MSSKKEICSMCEQEFDPESEGWNGVCNDCEAEYLLDPEEEDRTRKNEKEGD